MLAGRNHQGVASTSPGIPGRACDGQVTAPGHDLRNRQTADDPIAWWEGTLAVKERVRAVESPRPALRPARVLAPERQPAVPTGPLRAPGAASPAPVIEQEKGLVPGAAALVMPGLSGASALQPADRDQRAGPTARPQAPAQGNARIARRMRAGEQGPATDYEAGRPGPVAAAAPTPAPTGLMASRADTAPSQSAPGAAATPAPTAEPALTTTPVGPPAPAAAAPPGPTAATAGPAAATAGPAAPAAVGPPTPVSPAAAAPAAAAPAHAAAAPAAVSPAAAEAPVTTAGPSAVTAAAAAGGRRRARRPHDDPGFRAVVTRVNKAAADYRRHGSAHGAAGAAQAAAPGPANEVQAGAKAQQVAKIDDQHPKEFGKAAFADLLRSRVDAQFPKNPVEARDFPSSGKLGELKGEMTDAARTSAADAGADVRGQAEAAPDQSGVTPKAVTPLPDTAAAPPAGDLGAAQAAPKPLPAAEVSAGVQAQQQQLDTTLTQAGVTDTQLAAGNEPTFAKALADKQAAGQTAAGMQAQYRAAESATIAGAQAQAVAVTGQQTAAMHGQSAALLGQVTGHQHGTMAADQASRAQVTAQLEAIYEKTQRDVQTRLDQLDKDAGDAFDAALSEARQVFESYVQAELDKRYSDVTVWIKDKLLTWGLPPEVQAIFVAGRARFIESMDAAIDRVAGLVADGLNEAKQKSADGRTKVDDTVKGLPAALRDVGREAAQSIGAKFDQLDQSITAKQDQLADMLAARYADGIKQLDDRITQLESEHAGLISKALSSVTGVISTILEMKNLLLKVLAKAVATINVIIADPIGFLGHLVDAVGLGIRNFVGNILTHLKQGFFEWLFGEVAAAGITLPKTWDLQGIFGLVMQILGLTWPNIRKIAVEVVGEPIVHILETAAEPIIVLIREGPAGLWNWIKEQLGYLKAMVVDQLQSWLITRVIKAGITWLIGLLNPASAFVKACKAIYDILEFIWTRGKQILEFVNAVVDSIAEIAAGSLGKAAQKVEDALARAIPVTIGFLAGLLGLGGLSETIKDVIDKIQQPVHAAVKWLITKAVALIKAAGKLLGFGKKEDEPSATDPEHDTKVAAGLDDLANEEKQASTQGQSHAEAAAVAKEIRERHSVFTSLEVGGGELNWEFTWAASKGGKVGGALKAPHDAAAKESLLKLDQDLSGAIAELKAYWESQDKEYKEYASTEAKDEGQVGSYGTYSEISLSDPAGMEREHIIPRATMGAVTSGYGFDIPADSPEYREQFALVVSKRTADIKTGRSSDKVEGIDPRYQPRSAGMTKNLLSADNRVSRKLKEFVARQAKASEKKVVKLRQLFDAKVELTIRARNEARETAPTDAEIRGAALAQLESVLQMVRDRYMADE